MNSLAVAVAVILFPGLIAAVIADKITVHYHRWGSFKYTIYSFVFGVSCYILLQCLVWIMGLFPSPIEFLPSLAGTLDVWTLASNGATPIDLPEVAAATAASIPVAFIASFLVNHKAFNRLATRLKVSRKYGDENLFSFYLNSDDLNWVYIRDTDRKLTYHGRVQAYSETDQMQEIILFDVTVYGYEDSEEYYSVPSIYLCRNIGKFAIEAAIPDNKMENNND